MERSFDLCATRFNSRRRGWSVPDLVLVSVFPFQSPTQSLAKSTSLLDATNNASLLEPSAVQVKNVITAARTSCSSATQIDDVESPDSFDLVRFTEEEMYNAVPNFDSGFGLSLGQGDGWEDYPDGFSNNVLNWDNASFM